MNGADPPLDPEDRGDGSRDRSSGEETLEREAELQGEEEAKREVPERDERSVEPETEEEAAEEDAEEVESEWHTWLLGGVVVIGIALFFAPGFFLPELLGTLGAFLVAIGVLGWAVKWAIGRGGR